MRYKEKNYEISQITVLYSATMYVAVIIFATTPVNIAHKTLTVKIRTI